MGAECLKLGLFQKTSDVGSLCTDQGGTREGRQALKSDRPDFRELPLRTATMTLGKLRAPLGLCFPLCEMGIMTSPIPLGAQGGLYELT